MGSGKGEVGGLLNVAAAGAIWSTVGPVLKAGVMLGGGVFWIAALRTLFSSIPALLAGRWRWMFRRELIAYGALLISAFQASYLLAIHRVGVALAVVLLYTAPAWVIVMSRLMFGESITVVKAVSLAMAVVGVVLVSGVSNVGFEGDVLGILLGAASGLVYALMTVYGKVLRSRGVGSFEAATASPIWAFIVLAPVAAFVDELTLGLWLLSPLYLGLVAGSLAYYLFFRGVGSSEAGKAGIAALVEPALGVFIGVVVMGEPITPYKAVGSLLIILAVTATVVESMSSGSRGLRLRSQRT